MSVHSSPLGKKSAYIDQYDPTLLFPIPRTQKRLEIGISGNLPFYGYDTWNAFELSWLDNNGKPNVALAKFIIACTSDNIVESKSFKLYLNSFNNTKINSVTALHDMLTRDIQQAVNGDVVVEISDIENLAAVPLRNFEGECLDQQVISVDAYTVNPALLRNKSNAIVSETVYSNLLKSNCLVTGQPDWGSVQIDYEGSEIDKAGLLKYIISFRNHNEFHEQCVERIFVDILAQCKPTKLTVHARYTRRGGLDINPIRSTEKITPPENFRMTRQ